MLQSANTSTPQPQQTPQPSVHDRLKAALFTQPQGDQPGSQGDGDEQVITDETESKAPDGQVAKPAKPDANAAKANEQVEGDEPEADAEAEADVDADAPSDDAQTEELQLSSLNDLAEATGLTIDKILDLEVPTKIDGKEGTARLRDLQKSYQLDGHINQKLASLDTDRKAFQAEREKVTRESAERLLKLDAGAKTLERALAAEFAAVDWQKLQAEDPLAFNAQYVAYQQRYQVLQDIAGQIAAEQQQARATQEAQFKDYVAEQRKLFEAKLPEWSDPAKRGKDRAEILEYLKTVGFSKEEFEQVIDHRQALIIRDAWNWHKLQKSKPATLNKVKAAPRLLKPGTLQSRAAKNNLGLQKDRDRLRSTGKPRDAAQVLKRLGIV